MLAVEALEVLKTFLKDSGLKMTAQRRIVTEAFFDSCEGNDHPTVEELYLIVRARDVRVGYATVYRTLKLLVDCGLASPGRFGDNQTRYEPEAPGTHHDHFVCSECGAILEFENESIETLQEEIARALGFQLTDHKMVLFGRPLAECEVENCRRQS